MDTKKRPISSASFMGHVFSELVIKLQRKDAIKAVSLILVVMLCTIIRYVAISTDENLIKKNYQTEFIVNDLKLPIWPPELILKSKKVKKQMNYGHKLQNIKLMRTEKTFYSFVKD